MEVSETMFLGAMTLHNSSIKISRRLLRHFHLVPFMEYSHDQMFMIYNTILTFHFS